jgi:hypothetical protein
MASVAADMRGSIGWLLVIGGLLSSVGRAGRGAQPEPPLPAAEKPAIEEPAAAPPAGEKPADARTADERQAVAAQRAAATAERKRALAERNAAAVKQAADKKQPAADPLEGQGKGVKRVNLDNVAQANALAQQWRPTLMVELSFIRLVCPNLPPQQRVVVKAAGEQALFSAADAAATPRAMALNGVALKAASPQALIRTALSDALHEVLPKDLWERFAAESAARAERRKTAVIRLVVEHLDEALYLTTEQRDQISRSLADHWQSAWENWLQLRYARNLPVMPEDIVTPYLDQDQRIAWEKIPKVQLGNHVMHVNMGNVAPENTDWWDEAIPREKDAAADVPPP